MRSFNSHHQSWFGKFAGHAARFAGHPLTFAGAVAVIVLWAVSGPVFGYSDTWQLIINTSTTIITFLMVFLIQNSQNRDSVALQIKLDELIRAGRETNDALLDLEELDEGELQRIRADFEKLAEKARGELDRRQAIKPSETPEP